MTSTPVTGGLVEFCELANSTTGTVVVPLPVGPGLVSSTISSSSETPVNLHCTMGILVNVHVHVQYMYKQKFGGS